MEPSHTGPFALYQKDEAGIVLHDVLFAPFFAGAAGPGHIWHWDVYVDRMDLWHHFGRFAEAIRGIDPPAEQFKPQRVPHRDLRVLALAGRTTFLAWCRDPQNTWETELAEGRPPREIRGASVDVDLPPDWPSGASARVYNPWMDGWCEVAVEGGRIELPPFSRSLVVKVERPSL